MKGIANSCGCHTTYDLGGSIRLRPCSSHNTASSYVFKQSDVEKRLGFKPRSTWHWLEPLQPQPQPTESPWLDAVAEDEEQTQKMIDDALATLEEPKQFGVDRSTERLTIKECGCRFATKGARTPLPTFAEALDGLAAGLRALHCPPPVCDECGCGPVKMHWRLLHKGWGQWPLCVYCATRAESHLSLGALYRGTESGPGIARHDPPVVEDIEGDAWASATWEEP